VTLRDITTAALHLDVASGRVELRDVAGPVDVRAESGSVAATGLRATSWTSTTASGAVAVDFAVPPRSVRVDAGSGAVTLGLPDADGPYRIDARSETGETRITVPTDPTAPRVAVVRAGSGDITVLIRPASA
jgi:hypothetical protein